MPSPTEENVGARSEIAVSNLLWFFFQSLLPCELLSLTLAASTKLDNILKAKFQVMLCRPSHQEKKPNEKSSYSCTWCQPRWKLIQYGRWNFQFNSINLLIYGFPNGEEYPNGGGLQRKQEDIKTKKNSIKKHLTDVVWCQYGHVLRDRNILVRIIFKSCPMHFDGRFELFCAF